MTASSPKEHPSETPAEADAERAGPAKSGDTDPLIGKVISDRFRILAPIARGGMGIVYKAEQAPLGRLVAVKILSLKHDEAKDPEFRRRFFLEAATVAKLTHPNTVTVFDYGQGDVGQGDVGQGGAGGIYYIAMELVNGRTLKRALVQEGPFSPARALHIAKQMCRSLREAHRLGVIHRDMKPGNVMLVDRDGEDYVKVLDFGLVKELHPDDPEADLTQAGVFMGSPKYMSPEQIQGEPVDGRTDIYAIGVMLYELMTGRVPFNRENPMQILMDHVREPVPPMATPAGTPPIPPEVQAIVFKCLEKNASDRYADMEALLVGLRSGGGDGLSISSTSREVALGLSTGSVPVSGVHSLGAESPANGIPLGEPTAISAHPSPSRLPAVLASIAVLAAIVGVGALATGLIGGPATPDVAIPAPLATPPTTVTAPPAERAEGVAIAAVPSEAEAAPPADVAPSEIAPLPTLMLSLRSFPRGATVRIGDREYGPTPAEIELIGPLAAEGTELELVFSRSGYRSTTVRETVRGPTLEVTGRMPLIRRGGGGGGSGGGATTAEDPGGVRVEGYRDSPY